MKETELENLVGNDPREVTITHVVHQKTAVDSREIGDGDEKREESMPANQTPKDRKLNLPKEVK